MELKSTLIQTLFFKCCDVHWDKDVGQRRWVEMFACITSPHGEMSQSVQASNTTSFKKCR